MAGNGREALAALDDGPFDAVLMDVQMPEMDGFEATAAIRARESATGAHTPIVAMTAHALKGDRERCLEAGMDAYVSKPLRPQELFDVLARLVPAAGERRPAPAGPEPPPAAFDMATALERVDGDLELMTELAGLFLGECPQRMEDIRRAIGERDGPGLERAAHYFKGSVGNFGARRASEAAERLERAGRDRIGVESSRTGPHSRRRSASSSRLSPSWSGPGCRPGVTHEHLDRGRRSRLPAAAPELPPEVGVRGRRGPRRCRGLALFEGGSFPMVITDWMMPELDGSGLLRRIRASQRPGYVYAILLTAKSQKEDLVEGMEAGADDFLTKPFDRDELRVRLRAGERIIRLEHHLRETQAALVQKEQLASLGRLAAGVAHEINNPIAYVMNNIAVLRRDVQAVLAVLDKYAEGREALVRAEPELAAEVATVGGGDGPGLLPAEPGADVRRVGRRSATHPRDRAESPRLRPPRRGRVQGGGPQRGPPLDARGPGPRAQPEGAARGDRFPGHLTPVACNPGKINQVFLQVLLNAIQASDREGLIEVRTRPDGEDAVLVEIEDHDGGILPEHLPHIFEPFFTTKPVGAGTGLGLSVSYGIVRDHGGSLEVESTVGRGSVFRVRLPVQSAGTVKGSSPVR